MFRLAALLLMVTGAAFAQARDIWVFSGNSSARYFGDTHRYGHGIMGDLPEWGGLCLTIDGQQACIELPETQVFEDMVPHLADMTGDGRPEAIAVRSSVTGGSALVVYRLEDGALVEAATPEIGHRNRWLAKVGAADFNGDGTIDFAYVEKPHLSKELKIWTWRNGRLKLIAAARGLSNHRIGETFISGGIRDCGQGPEIVTANSAWSKVFATRFEGGTLVFDDLGGLQGHGSFRKAMSCQTLP